MARRTSTLPLPPLTRLAFQAGETLWASSVVIPLRLGRMAAAGLNPGRRDRREFARMAPEKLQAGTRSLFGVALALQQMQLRWLMRAWQPWLRAASGLAFNTLPLVQLSSAALAPIHRTATANARRLTRVTPRCGAARR